MPGVPYYIIIQYYDADHAREHDSHGDSVAKYLNLLRNLYNIICRLKRLVWFGALVLLIPQIPLERRLNSMTTWVHSVSTS